MAVMPHMHAAGGLTLLPAFVPNRVKKTFATACANAFDYDEPTCLSNSTLYLGTGELQDFSCAHCVCDDGWGGVDCGRCLDVSVCPGKVIDGQVYTRSVSKEQHRTEN